MEPRSRRVLKARPEEIAEIRAGVGPLSDREKRKNVAGDGEERQPNDESNRPSTSHGPGFEDDPEPVPLPSASTSVIGALVRFVFGWFFSWYPWFRFSASQQASSLFATSNPQPWFQGTRQSSHSITANSLRHSYDGIRQSSDTVFVGYEPAVPKLDIVFFHGLQLEYDSGPGVHLSTWTCGEDPAILWPQHWLRDRDARIFFIHYDASLKKTNKQGRMDLTNIAENLSSELQWALRKGQETSSSFRPIVFVGHSFGGLVIKQLCLHAAEHGSDAQKKWLEGVEGILFCGTPHLGSKLASMAKKLKNRSPLMRFVKLLGKEVGRQGENFRRLYTLNKWEIFCIGETRETNMSTICPDLATGEKPSMIIVEQSSARLGENFMMVDADHISLCKAEKTTSNMFQFLLALINRVDGKAKEPAGPSRVDMKVPKMYVGVDSHVGSILSEIAEKRAYIGICGMGGVGKTTMAKYVFNRINAQFEYACFIDGVKDIPGTKRDVKRAVWELITPPLEGDYKESRWAVEMKQKRVLVVFDDVGKDEDLEVLMEIARPSNMEESCFIVTSRDEQLFRHVIDNIYVSKVLPLGQESARQLFISHAFLDPEQLNDLENVVEQIVRRCDGLPLTIEVIGKSLRGVTNKERWKEIPQALENIDSIEPLEKRVWSKLRLSVDSLGPGELEMFLDVASIFTDSRKYFKYPKDPLGRYKSFSLGDVMSAWTSLYGSAHNRWRTLVDRSLIYDHKMPGKSYKDGLEFKPRMHEHLKHLGQKIAKDKGRILTSDDTNEGAQGLENVVAYAVHYDGDCSEVSDFEDAESEDAMDIEDDESVEDYAEDGVPGEDYAQYDADAGEYESKGEGDVLDCCDKRPCGMKIAWRTVQHLKSLRFLVVWDMSYSNVACKRCRRQQFQLPPSLVLLYWHATPFSKTELQCSTHSKQPGLAVLRVNGSVLGSINPMLIKESAPNEMDTNRAAEQHTGRKEVLTERQASTFGNFTKLERLELLRCGEISFLQVSFGLLVHLHHLEFHWCYKLQALPNNFGNLAKLERLVLRSCQKIQLLPDSFGQLVHLQYLTITGCDELQALPNNLGKLAKLEVLLLYGCPEIEFLPDSFGQLAHLQRFEIKRCHKLQALPNTFGNLSKLERMELDRCRSIQFLPDSFGELVHLQYLHIADCEKLQALPNNFGNLAKLERLALDGCGDITLLPDSFGELVQLQHLVITRCEKLQALPNNFGNLAKLETLILDGCGDILLLPDSFGELVHLDHLRITSCEKLRALPNNIGNLAKLERLGMDGCTNMPLLPDSFGELVHLDHLRITSCEKLQALPNNFGNLAKLETLILDGCRDMPLLPDSFGELVQLQYLVITGCEKLQALPNNFGNLAKLERLELCGCGEIQSLPDSFDQLPRSLNLIIENCRKLMAVPYQFRNLNHPQLQQYLEVWDEESWYSEDSSNVSRSETESTSSDENT